MNGEKPWYESRAVWGGLVSLAAALAGLGGLEIGAPIKDALTVAILDAVAALGALAAIYGRLAAETKLR